MERIPSKAECLQLMKQHHMWDHIIQHSLKVAQVALFLARALNRTGERLNLGLIEASSLLHDITKKRSIQNKEDHVITGADLLKDLGYDRVSEIVKYHVRLPRRRLLKRITEAEIVNYADKRVLHDRIVTLKQRFADVKLRYAKNKRTLRRINATEQESIKLEDKIFSKLSIDPGDIAKLM